MELDGPRFFSLARRVFAYQGVMAARNQQLKEEEEQPQRPAQARAAQQQVTSDSNVIPFDQFRAQFPGLIG